jgi:hypothetical protein
MSLDMSNPLVIAGIVAAIGILLVIIWLFTVILRLLFDHKPTFPAWQPPYLPNAMINPNTTGGRRQLWQQQAQSDALPLPCDSGSHIARKLLIGMNGAKLGGWQITGLRLSQYDMYGRLGKTQVIADNRTLKRANKALRNARKWSVEKTEKSARSLAKALLKPFRKRISRTAPLPIALDVRFKGNRGSVRLLFELHQCMGDRWQIIDTWEPEMNISSSILQENYTYALFGKRGAETRKQFEKRLQSDLTSVIAAMIAIQPAVQPAAAPTLATTTQATQPLPPAPPTPPSIPPVPSVDLGDTARVQAMQDFEGDALTPPPPPPLPLDDVDGEYGETAPLPSSETPDSAEDVPGDTAPLPPPSDPSP